MNKKVVKLLSALAIVLISLCLGVIFIYQHAQVLDLKSTISYQPIGSRTIRVAGLRATNFVSLKKIPTYVPEIILLCEDSSFFTHRGFDLGEMKNSINKFRRRGKKLRGASTISQQLMKNVFFNQKRSFIRKFLEALYTIKLENNFSKNEILSLYLSNIQWGTEIYGISTAAKYYFNKNVSELSLVDTAFLAAIIPNPVKYSESFHKKKFTPFMKNRITEIIHKLYQYQRISSETEYLDEVDQFFVAFELDSSQTDEEIESDEDSD